MKFKEIYYFSVLDEIEDGKTVYCLDKELKVVKAINEVTVAEALKIIDLAKKESGRFAFWSETKESEESEND